MGETAPQAKNGSTSRLFNRSRERIKDAHRAHRNQEWVARKHGDGRGGERGPKAKIGKHVWQKGLTQKKTTVKRIGGVEKPTAEPFQSLRHKAGLRETW